MVAHKQRNYSEANTVESISLLSAVSLKGKTVWIVDDMIDTGGSIYGLIKELSTRECKEVNVIVIHPVLSGPAADRLRELKNTGILGRLVACDTVCCNSVIDRLPFLEVISSANLSARIVLTISQDRQMADLIDTFCPKAYLT
jgi:ribose-phosphate pyrophosphokinase